MLLNFFLGAEKENFGKTLAISFTYAPYLSSRIRFELCIDLRTVRFKYGTFRVYNTTKSTKVRHQCRRQSKRSEGALAKSGGAVADHPPSLITACI